jgi:hypothetical protein
MRRIDLVRLIEGLIGELSPESREAWEELEQLALLSPPERDGPSEFLRIWETKVIPEEEAAFKALILLRVGLAAEYPKEDTSRREAREFRRVCAIKAAQVVDHAEGRPVDPDMSAEQAIARLRRSQGNM